MSKESTVMQDSLYVNWHLLDGLNHNCPYSHEPDSVINERFYREPLLETAYRLLSLNRPEYVFHLYGGEPTIHPYFKDLVGYIATSGRNVRMILETNGIRLLKYYLSLLEPIAPKCLCVRFAVHLKYMELENALKFIGLVTDQKQLCKVILNWVPEYDGKAHLFYDKFTKFQRVNTFGVSVAFPMGGSAPWLENYAEQHKAVEPDFPSWTTVPGADGEKDAQRADGSRESFAGSGDNLILEFADEVSVVGVHAVQVAADGSCTLGLVKDDEPFAPKILQGAALRDDLPKAPGFESGEEAKSWLSDFTKRALAYEIDGGPVRNPLGNEGLEQEVRFKLKRLAPLSNYQRKLKIYPELWLERKEEILKVFEALADGASRDVLLRRLKAQLFGQSAYFVRSDYAEFCHSSLSGIPFEADGSHRRLRFENVKAGELKELRAKIAWYKPALEIVLPTSPEWLDILAELANTLPDYSLYLGQHGIKTVAYAKSAKPRKRYHPIPLRTLDGNPLVSVIVKAAYDEEELGKTIDSIEREGLPRYEIILVQDNPVMSETLEEFVRKNPWHVRAFRFNDDLSLSRAYDAGLDMAQGEYVCFLRCGDCVREGALKEAVETLETENADLLIFSREPACCMEGKTALSRYLTGELKTQGLSNKIYRTNVIHSYAIEIMDLPGNMEDDLFNLPMLHFSGKVVCQHGDLVIREEREDCDEDEPTANERFDVFIKRLGRILDFCRANGIALDSPALKAHILRLFEEVEDDFASLVHEADESGTLGEFLTHDVLASIKSFPDIASRLFRKCLEWQGKREDLPKVVMVDSTALETPFEEYAGVAKNYEHEPKLSFVITVSGSESLSLLESLAQENMATIECLVLNSSRDSGTIRALEELADLYPNVRVWHTEGDIYLLHGVRLALKEAKGRAVTFAKGNDEVDSGFIENAIKAFSLIEKVDLAVFGWRSIDGEERDLSAVQEKLMDRNELVRTLFEQDMALDLRGVVFAKELLQKSLVDFAPVFLEEGDEYLLTALKGVTKAYVSPIGEVISSEEEGCPLTARACNVVRGIDDLAGVLKSLFSDETAQDNGFYTTTQCAENDELKEKVLGYYRKELSGKYLPTIAKMAEGDLSETEKICTRMNCELSDVQLMILCAESSMNWNACERDSL